MKRHNAIRIKWMLAGFTAYMFVAAIAIGQEAQKAWVLKDPILKYGDDIEYAKTGVAESKDDPRWPGAQAKIEFATTLGALYSDVNVEIKDSAGKQVFAGSIDRPWLVIMKGLKPGTYTVNATNKAGVAKSGTLNIPASGPRQDITFKW